MSTLHADRALAARIEHSVARDLACFAETCVGLDPTLGAASMQFAGGLALFLAPGSPVNMIYGAGFGVPVSGPEFDAVERFYAEHGTRAAISLSPLADEALVAQLGVRGWMVTDFESVLVRQLATGARDASDVGCAGTASSDAHVAAALGTAAAPAPGVSLHTASTPDERARWAEVSSAAFAAPDTVSAEGVRLAVAMAARDDVTLLLGSVDGAAAGTGALQINSELAWLLSDATLPELRGRGVQSALLAERTRLAAAAGCELAVTEARPGSTSQRNMERLGYRVVYTRVELIAPPPRR